MLKGLCFKCKQTGYIATNCPTKNVAAISEEKNKDLDKVSDSGN